MAGVRWRYFLGACLPFPSLPGKTDNPFRFWAFKRLRFRQDGTQPLHKPLFSPQPKQLSQRAFSLFSGFQAPILPPPPFPCQLSLALSITHKLGFAVDDNIPSIGQILKSLPTAPDRGNTGFAIGFTV